MTVHLKAFVKNFTCNTKSFSSGDHKDEEDIDFSVPFKKSLHES